MLADLFKNKISLEQKIEREQPKEIPKEVPKEVPKEKNEKIIIIDNNIIKPNLIQQIKENNQDEPMIKTKEQYEQKLKELSRAKMELAMKVIRGITDESKKSLIKEERKILREKIKRFENELMQAKDVEVDYNKLTRSQLIADIMVYAPLCGMIINEQDLKMKSDKALADLHVVCSIKIAQNCSSSSKFMATLYILSLGIIETYSEPAFRKYNSSIKGLSKNTEELRTEIENIFAQILKENPQIIKYFNVWTQLVLVTFQSLYITIERNKKKQQEIL